MHYMRHGHWLRAAICYTILTLVLVTSVSSEEQYGLDNVWISKIFSDTMWTFAVNSSVNTECTQQGLIYLKQLDNNTHWAIRMLDASLVTPSGLISGDSTQFGHPDQCIQTRIPVKNFYPKYCLPTAHFAPYPKLYPQYYDNHSNEWPPYDVEKNVWDFISPRDDFIRHPRHSFRWGICVPDICTAEDVQTALNETLFQAFAKHQIQFDVNLTDVNCYTAAEVESNHLPLAGVLWVSFWIAFLILAAIGTTLEYQDSLTVKIPNLDSPVKDEKVGEVKSFLLIFSFIRNSNDLSRTTGSSAIVAIDGVKGLLMCLIMMFHRAMFSMGFAKNLEHYEEAFHSIKYFLVTGTSHTLDAFFFFSGFLLAWGIINKLNKNRTINYWTTIVNRIFRIYPMYVLIIAFNIWVLPYIGQGPLWKSFTEAESQYCRQNWWQNLLFISSLTDHGEMCLASTWYLSTDFQLFLISLALIYLITKAPSWRAHILVVAFILAHTIPSVVIYFTNSVSFWMLSIREMREHVRIPNGYVRTTYNKFYIRIPPYIYGVCTAYVIDYMVKKKFKFNQMQMVTLFLSTNTLNILVYIVGSLFYLPGHEYSVWEHVIFAIPYRFILATTLAVSLMVVQCGGYGAVNCFFSTSLLVVLGRISYHMYLLNYLLIPLDIYVGQSSNYVNLYLFTLRGLGDLGLISLLSYVSTMLLEPPMEKLRRKLLPN